MASKVTLTNGVERKSIGVDDLITGDLVEATVAGCVTASGIWMKTTEGSLVLICDTDHGGDEGIEFTEDELSEGSVHIERRIPSISITLT